MSAIYDQIKGAFAFMDAPFGLHPRDRERAVAYRKAAVAAGLSWADAEADVGRGLRRFQHGAIEEAVLDHVRGGAALHVPGAELQQHGPRAPRHRAVGDVNSGRLCPDEAAFLPVGDARRHPRRHPFDPHSEGAGANGLCGDSAQLGYAVPATLKGLLRLAAARPIR